jgi:hypothetical protein
MSLPHRKILFTITLFIGIFAALTTPTLAGFNSRNARACVDGIRFTFDFTTENGETGWEVYAGPNYYTNRYGVRSGAGSFSGNVDLPYSLNLGATVHIYYYTHFSGSGGLSGYQITVADCRLFASDDSAGEEDGPKPGPPAMNLYDGRFNNFQDQDVAAPVAIYDGSIKVYGIDPISGDGWLSMDISKETIDATGIPTDTPALLGQGQNHYTGIDIFVYRLPTGEFQINTHYADGKAYIFAWDEDGSKWHFAA